MYKQTQEPAEVDLHDRLQTLINDSDPKPVYQLWQQVRFERLGFVKAIGRIVGYCWTSPACAFENETFFGWHYTVQYDLEHFSVHEDELEVLEGDRDVE
jgi:hypothetical protein